MKIREIKELLDAVVICGEEYLEKDVFSACGSDMMSDVLAFVKDQSILLTGLLNSQVIRTAEMMDMRCIVFVRNKRPCADVIELAKENGITILASPDRMYEACGRLYAAGLKGGCTSEK